MSLSDYVQRTRSIIEGYGLGEKPAIVQVAADAGNTVTNSLVDVTLASGEAANVAKGDVLGTYGASTEATAWVGYVTAVNGTTDVVTCVNGYGGSTAIANAATTHDNGLLYIHGNGPTDFEIFNAIEVVEETLLYPHIYKIEFDTEASPSMATRRVDLDAEVMEVMRAWQVIGTERYDIGFFVEHNAPSEATPSSAGVVGTFDLVNSSTLYLETVRKMVVGTDESTYPQLIELVSTAAAAIASGWQRPETTRAISKQDSRERGQAPDVGAALWRDFFALRESWADDLARRRADEIIVYR